MAHSTTKQRQYEGLFLMNQQITVGGVGEALAAVSRILDRAGAQILSLGKWEDRKLAYPIRGQKRGTYINAIFRVDGVQIANIERDCNLGDEVTRVLIISADHLGETEIELARREAEKSLTESKLTAPEPAPQEEPEPVEAVPDDEEEAPADEPR